MRRSLRPSVGLLGRLLAILLLIFAFEFAANTVLYEGASRALVRDDEAHRLAEHLVIARALIAERSPGERPAMAAQLTTSRYRVVWMPVAPHRLPDAGLATMRDAVIAWEPALTASDLRLWLVTSDRHPWLFGTLRMPDGSWLEVRAAAPISVWDIVLHRVMLSLLPAAILLVVGALMFRRALRPMNVLARAAERIGRGGGLSLPEAGPGEVRRVIRAFNAMQSRIHDLIADRTQALAAVGHDLRTPLARMQLRTDAVNEPELRTALQDDVAEMEAMVGSLLAYLGGESDPETPVLTDVAVLAATIIDDATDRGGDARYDGPDHCEARIRPVALKRALGNLVENALHYGRTAEISLSAEADMLLLCVDDDGPGIPAERMADALRPFSRLDPARGRNTGGLGLGLAIVARIAELAGGTLRLENRAEGGLRAALSLPRR